MQVTEFLMQSVNKLIKAKKTKKLKCLYFSKFTCYFYIISGFWCQFIFNKIFKFDLHNLLCDENAAL